MNGMNQNTAQFRSGLGGAIPAAAQSSEVAGVMNQLDSATSLGDNLARALLERLQPMLRQIPQAVGEDKKRLGYSAPHADALLTQVERIDETNARLQMILDLLAI